MSRPNVVLIVMDTARERDVFPGNGAVVTPFLEELAAAGTRFEQAIAPAPWTLPSHASLFTGTYPSKHGAHADHKRLGDRLATLPSAFHEAGYETVAVSNNTWISEEFGFGRGFERFHKTWQYVQAETDLGAVARTTEGASQLRPLARRLVRGNLIVNLLNAVYGKFLRKQRDSGARRTNRWIEAWLDDRTDERPFFLFVNYLEPHLEYRPPAEYAEPYLPASGTVEEAKAVSQDAWAYIAGETDHDEREFALLRALYRGEIAYLDERLGELKATLEANGAWEDTVFVVTSDHGENVGDHGMMDHQYCLYETLLHVPLVAHGGPFTGGGEREDLVSLTDRAPTLVDVADVDAPAVRSQCQGRSLLPAPDAGSGGPHQREQVFAEYLAPQPSLAALEQRVGTLSPALERFDRSLRALRRPDWKLIRGSDGSRECYRVDEDPDEQEDVTAGEQEDVTAGEQDDGTANEQENGTAGERAADGQAVVDELTATLDAWLESFEHAASDDDVEMSAATRRRLERLGYLQE